MNTSRMTWQEGERGITTLLVLVFMGIFVMILGMITSYAFEEARYGRALYGREQALSIAESGLEYYKWFLAHNPGNVTNGTGAAGPYTYAVNDPEGGQLGGASIQVTGHSQCGVLQYIDISSTGTSDLNPGFTRTVDARYMQKSVAWYSYLLDSNVEAGSDRDITGPYFSNGGIHMEGANHSDVLSPLTSWYCGNANPNNYGCTPVQSSAPGVVGDSGAAGAPLWHWGSSVSSISFTGIASTTALKNYARYNGGLYFGPASGSVNSRGYHLIFNSNGTVTVKTVSSTIGIPSYSTTHGWSINYPGYSLEYSIINNQSSGTTYTIPSSCSLIFVEDRAWIEGTVKGKVTVVASTPSDTSTTPDVYLANDINYAAYDGTNGLTVISEGGILIPLLTPSTMQIHGVFVATTGAYERPQYTANYYGCPYYDVNCISSSYSQYALRTKLTTVGSVVSKLRTGTAWGSGATTISGYQTRVDSYDELQAIDPPPFTPAAATDYGFQLWREQ